MKKTRVEISFEQRETWQISQGNQTETRQCGRCFDPAPMIPAENLAALAEISAREIYKQIEEGELHFYENASQQVFVCLASFSNLNGGLEKKQKRILAAP